MPSRSPPQWPSLRPSRTTPQTPVPEGYHTATHVLTVDNGLEALELNGKAFSGKERPAGGPSPYR
jgi:hypothetical protein